jgi:hypothetical protein
VSSRTGHFAGCIGGLLWDGEILERVLRKAMRYGEGTELDGYMSALSSENERPPDGLLGFNLL